MVDATPPPEPSPPPPSLDSAEIRGLVREELDRNNKYLEFAQGQIEKDRNFYKHLYQVAATVILILVGVAGFLQYNSISQMRSDMKASLELAQTTVRDELAHVRTEVKTRMDDEFRTAHITALVADAAKERTGAEILGVLHSEVGKAIDEQKPTIETAVIDQTKSAVSALEPEIKSTISKVTQGKLDAALKQAIDGADSKARSRISICPIGRNGGRRPKSRAKRASNHWQWRFSRGLTKALSRHRR